MSGWLARLRQENPQLTVSTEVQRGSHPYLTADYRVQFAYTQSCTMSLKSALLT